MNLQKSVSRRSFSRSLTVITACLSLFALSGCDAVRNSLKPDRSANLEMQDYKDALAPRLPEVDDTDSAAGGSIPGLQPYVASGNMSYEAMPLVSISVNQSVPLRDVLFELAKQADYDLELDPRIRGSIIFTARNRPFDRVIERISDIAGLRYKFEDNTLRVELDTPYNKTYKIDYLSYIRTNASSVRNDIAVVSGDGADTGSSFETTAESEANFWGELETNIAQILGSVAGNVMKTDVDPRITVTEQNPDVQAVAVTDEDGNVQVQPPDAVINIESLPVDDAAAVSSGGGREGSAQASFAINRQAGMISVFANERAHKEIQDYLTLVKKAVTSQVLIEAKILEVTLNDEYATGIDWRSLGLLSDELSFGYLTSGAGDVLNSLLPSAVTTGGTIDPANTLTEIQDSNFIVGYTGNDVQALVQAVSGFGTVKALASPRLTVLNNQSAVLNVATNRVFFEVDIDVTNDGTTVQTDIDSDIRNVPEGVLVNVLPSINLDQNTVSLALRPTVTRVVSTVDDPAIEFVAASADPPLAISSEIPVLNVQEIDSVIQVKSGQAIVLGGLLQDRVATDEDGVPILSEVPMFGALFRQHEDLIQKTELVILLKATILETPSQSVHNTDRDLYRKFSGDRRPFKL